jgi:uncharacterized protein
MASNLLFRLRPARQCLRAASRAHYSTEPPPPALFAKVKGDVKAALKAKDTPRLMVLRSVMSAMLNASKTASPIRTDAQLVGLLRKTIRSSQDAAAEFRAAGRDDLVEKEESQIRVLEEYCQGSGVETMTPEDLRRIVEGVKAELQAEKIEGHPALGEAMKRLLKPGGQLDGKDFDKAELPKLVKEIIVGQ